MSDSASERTYNNMDNSYDAMRSNMQHSSMDETKGKQCMTASPDSPDTTLSCMDPDSPMSWPLYKKIYTSAVAFAFAFVVLYGTTTYVVALDDVVKAYNITMQIAILGFTLPFFGVACAPLYTPHLSELYGRRPLYYYSISLFILCVAVIGIAPNMSTLLAFRFLAGFLGGPVLVLIEGTFADIWSAERTVTYYAFLAPASYLGAALGPVIGGFVLTAKGPAWLSWVTIFFATVALAFGAFMPETYAREILRQRNHYRRNNVTLPDALNGVTIGQMVKITFFEPMKMIMSEPLVILLSLYLGVVFAVVFQFFIAVPTVLNLLYGFDTDRQGLAFLSAVGGTILGSLSAILIETVSIRTKRARKYPVENRLLSAIVGSLLSAGALFWIAYTAKPTVNYVVPIVGTGVYVWGNIMSLISCISYIFDAYPPTGTLSTLTAAASFRLICAGIVPIFILNAITNWGGMWTYTTFGIISAAMHIIPDFLYMFGPKIRARSEYSEGGMSVMQSEIMTRHYYQDHHGQAPAGRNGYSMVNNGMA